jgi:hypothetical protein
MSSKKLKKETQELINRKIQSDLVWHRTLENKERDFMEIYNAMDACNRSDNALMQKDPFLLNTIPEDR